MRLQFPSSSVFPRQYVCAVVPRNYLWTGIKKLGVLIVVLTTGILQHIREGTKEGDLALTYNASLMPRNRPATNRNLLRQLPWLQVELPLLSVCPQDTLQ